MSTMNHGISNNGYRDIKQDLRKRKAEKNKIDLYRITILSWLIFAAAVLIIYFLLMN